MASYQAQDFLFQRIKELLPSHISLVDAVAETLHVSSDSAYRRIRGETPLVLEEARNLCTHFHISLDQILQVSSDSTLFHITRIHNQNYSFDTYLQGLLQQLKLIESFTHKEIIFLTKDLHIFANMVSRPFFAFRYFFWNKSIVQHPDFVTRAFDPGCLTESVIALSEEMTKTYKRIPSTEIWNTEAVNSIIFQVEYYKEAGYFSSASDIKTVYEAVLETLYHLQEEVENGTKFFPGENPSLKKPNLRFFYNRIVLGDNAIVVLTDATKTVYLNYDVLNYMVTRDEKFCNDTYREMENLIRRSTQISETSEKQRNIFFNILAAKIKDRIVNV